MMIADAQKVKGLAPLACKTDKIDARVLAELSPARSGAGDLAARPERSARERELARFRLHLVKHRSSAQEPHPLDPDHTSGKPCPVTDLFGVAGRELLDRLAIPEPWRGNVDASLRADRRPRAPDRDARPSSCAGCGADHPYIPLLMTAPGIGWVLAFTIAAEIGEIERFASPTQALPATPASARASTSPATPTAAGRSPSRAPATCAGRCSRRPCTPASTPPTPSATSATKRRLGKQRGAKVAQIDIARQLADAIWHMLTRNQPFAPGRRRFSSGGLTALLDLRPGASIQFRLVLPPRRR